MEYQGFAFIKNDLSIEPNMKIPSYSICLIEDITNKKATVFFINEWMSLELNLNDLERFDPEKTGDSYPRKICNICHRLLDTELFAKNQNAKNNRSVRRPSCRDCRKILEGKNMKSADIKEWKKTKPDRVPFECPICCKRTIPGITSKIVLDHDHDTGKVRGWICDSCNTGIGRFKDDVELLERAIKFLKENN